MFDRGKQFQVRIKSGGTKTAILSWPTDEQWCERTRKQRIVRRMMGGAMSEPEWPDREKVNAELFAAVRIDGDPHDEYEAVLSLERLERADLVSVDDIGGDVFEIIVAVHGGVETTHRLRIPTARESARYESKRVSRMDKGRESITRVSLEPVGELYDACVKSFTGYAEGQQPPIVHKVKAVFALLQALEDDEPDPE